MNNKRTSLLGVSTPCYIPATVAGNMPHLTQDNCEKLKDLTLVGINFGELYSSLNFLEQTNMDFNSYLQLPNECKVIFSITDVTNQPIARNTKTQNKATRSFESSNGRKQLGVDEYMKAVNKYKPSSFIALADEVDPTFGYKRQQSAVEMSITWLDECLATRPKATPIFGVLVGGNEPRLRDISVKESCKRSIDGVVISGFGGGESAEFREKTLTLYNEQVPAELPRILLNVGLPLDVLSSVALGVDAFMSSYPLIVTKFSYALVFWTGASNAKNTESQGTTKINLRDKQYERDSRPLLPGCDCFACNRFSRAYINHLLNVHEMLADVLLYMHNMHHYYQFFSAIREQIAAGTFESYRETFTYKYLQ
ncbi:queuine tRNA-ribosyltransferase domain-containing protein [Thraustotheca clavata]|uniref:Queuine tRNA-ribosyltransferase accessory subunit 2 n=1 Tax=Thraustotheca clavata TaxID=74557 RepID=A0A1V9Y8M7_9STRA|nr:queuine tRNA-ribosyltransferase domain-containing protein [Thraustotheca clavata]